MDLFAEALEDSFRADEEAAATPALSQCVVLNHGGVGTGMLGDIEDVATPQKVAPRKKRCSSGPDRACVKRRIRNPKNSLQLTKIEFNDGDMLSCVFIK